MIGSNEPKDGDFAACVEKSVRLPEGMRLPSGGASPGEVARLGSLLVFVGVALIAMSFADRRPVAVDRLTGIVLTAVGAVFRRVAGRLT